MEPFVISVIFITFCVVVLGVSYVLVRTSEKKKQEARLAHRHEQNRLASQRLNDAALRGFGKGVHKGRLHPDSVSASRNEDERIKRLRSTHSTDHGYDSGIVYGHFPIAEGDDD